MSARPDVNLAGRRTLKRCLKGLNTSATLGRRGAGSPGRAGLVDRPPGCRSPGNPPVCVAAVLSRHFKPGEGRHRTATYGKRGTGQRRVVGGDRAVPPTGTAEILGGRPRVPDRAALNGIIFVLRQGLRWSDLPQALDYGSGVTCWRRLRRWQAGRVAGRPPHASSTGWGCWTPSGGSGRAWTAPVCGPSAGGEATGPNPTDRGKRGTKYISWTTQGVPLPARLGGQRARLAGCWSPSWMPFRRSGARSANRAGRPPPAKLHGDKGYDYPVPPAGARRRGITPRIARRGIEFSERLGRHRWIVERTLAWVLAFRRLTVRYDRHAASVLAFLHLACTLICLHSSARPRAG